MRSTDFCFPLLRLRALAPHSFPASLRGLRLAPSPRACTLEDGGWGTRRFKTPDPLRRVAPGCCEGFSSPHSRRHRTSDTPVAFPWLSLRLRETISAESAETVTCKRSVKSARHDGPGCLPSPASRALRGSHHSRKRSREVFRFDVDASVSSPAAAYFRTV